MVLKFTKANSGNIVLAGLVDAALLINFFVMLFTLIPESLQSKLKAALDHNLFIFFGFILYRFLTIVIFDSTLGMKMFKLIFLNSEEERLNFKEKIAATFFVLYQGVDYFKRR